MSTVSLTAVTPAYPFITDRIKGSVYAASDVARTTPIQSQIDNTVNHPTKIWRFTGLEKNDYIFSIDIIDDAGIALDNITILDVTPSDLDASIGASQSDITRLEKMIVASFAGTVDSLTFDPGVQTTNVWFRANAGAGVYTGFLRAPVSGESGNQPITVSIEDGVVDFMYDTVTHLYKKSSTSINLSNYTKAIISDAISASSDIVPTAMTEITTGTSVGVLDTTGNLLSYGGFKTFDYLSNPSTDGYNYYWAVGLYNLSDGFSTLCYYDDSNNFLSSFRFTGNKVIAVPYGLKIRVSATQLFNITTPSTSKAEIDGIKASLITINGNFTKNIVSAAISAKSGIVPTVMTEITTGISTGVLDASGNLLGYGGFKTFDYLTNPSTDGYKFYWAVGMYALADGFSTLCYYDLSNNFLASFRMSSSNIIAVPHELKVRVSCTNLYDVTNYSNSKTEIDNLNNRVNNIESNSGMINTLQNKKGAFFGTSIPTGSDDMVSFNGGTIKNQYPLMIANLLGMTMYNEGVGSSIVRAFHPTSGNFKFMPYDACLKSLSQTVAEKQSILDHWTTGLDSNGNITGGTYGWKDLLSGNPPANWSDWQSQATILGWSYERKLIAKYLDTNSSSFVGTPDIFFIEHAHNDLAGNQGLFDATGNYYFDTTDANATDIPATRNDRSRYAGAMNYIIDVIRIYNSKAIIVIFGHYENQQGTNGVRIPLGQTKISDYQSMPLVPMWKFLAWSQQTITTTGRWVNGIWENSGGPSQTITMLQRWLADGLHPHTDLSGSANARIATTGAVYIKSIL